MSQMLIESLRFIKLLNVVYKEGLHLGKTNQRLFEKSIDIEWGNQLNTNVTAAEQLDAFAARYSRMQYTLGDKLVPSLLRMLAENTGSNLDNLNRIEKLGLLVSVTDWLEARNLRNKMVHEYIDDISELIMAVNRAHQLVTMLVDTYNNILTYAQARISIDNATWPGILEQ